MSPGTSQFSQPATLSIVGADITSYYWNAYYPNLPGTSRDVEDRPVRDDVHSGRRLSYGSNHVSIFSYRSLKCHYYSIIIFHHVLKETSPPVETS